MADLRDQLQSTLSGTYTLERELGGGGMARVFLAEETRFGRKVVVKVLSTEVAAGISAERFEREIRLAASLQQANIVPLLSASETNGIPYYTMPYVEGQSLRSRLAAGPLPIGEVVGILRDVARALDYAHAHGVVHRDIKPDNVLLSHGTAVVTDFGIAKALTASRTLTPGATLTQIGTSIGTPAYMAPEQAAGDPDVDYRADLYAFGCMAYELLAGAPPFSGRTPQKLLVAHMSERPVPIVDVRADTPAPLGALVMQCLEKDADARPQSARDVVALLDAVTSGEGRQAMPAVLLGGPGMLRRALLLYAGAFAGVAVLSKAAIVAIGLPDWVFPGALIVMALGLPVILFTGYAHRVSRRALTATPTYTPGGTPSLMQGTMATIALKASPHLSWRRAVMGGVYAVGAFAVLIGAFMLLRALGVGPAGSLLAAGRLSAHPRLIVADFGMKGTADSSLGSVVSEAVRTDLGQSDVVSVVPASTVHAALQRMQRPATSRLDPPLARELAQREGIQAMVSGDITPLGAGFLVTARIVEAGSGDELAVFHETADTPKELIPAVEKLTRDLRAKIGESLRAVHASPPLEQVTTPSLEALKLYSEASAFSDLDNQRAMALLKEAVALDTNFAMAWRKLAVLYTNTRAPHELRDSAIVRAFRHQDHLTESERLNVLAYYYGSVVHDKVKEIATYEEAVSRGFLLPAGHNLALQYVSQQRWAAAESLYRRLVATGDAPPVTYQNFVFTLALNRKFAEADSALRIVDRQFPRSFISYRAHLTLAYTRGFRDSVPVLAAPIARLPDSYSHVFAAAVFRGYAEMTGHLGAASRAAADQRAADASRGVSAPLMDDSLTTALYDVWWRGDPARAVRIVDAALSSPTVRAAPATRRPYLRAARIMALAGQPDRAKALVTEYDANVHDPGQRGSQAFERHDALAEIAIDEKRTDDALREVQLGLTEQDALIACNSCVTARRARIFDLAGKTDSAIVWFERYLDTPDVQRYQTDPDGMFLAGAEKRLGELYEAKGDRAKAASHYAAFVDLWKTADPELQPTVADVRRRLARLSDTERK